MQFWILYSDVLAKIPYFNYQINFQSHLTKKETEDASKRLSSYCMGAVNSYQSEFLFIHFLSFASSMDGNIKKCPQTETGSQTGALTLASQYNSLALLQFFRLVSLKNL